MQRGKFITIEGQDGAGKTTNIEFIDAALRRQGVEVVRTREPGGTPLGERLRALLLGDEVRDLDPMAELLIVFAARAQHIAEVIRPALARGEWVLCDRFTDATFAYQGGGRGLSEALIEDLQDRVQRDLRPDLTIVLDVDGETGAGRARTRSAPDRFERQDDAFRAGVRRVYRDIAAREPGRVKLVDASVALNEVQAAISAILDEFIDGHA